MYYQRFLAAGAAIILLVVVLGCGMDGPAPSGKSAAGGDSGSAASKENIKKIGLAFQNYASTYASALPPAAIVKNGKPYSSWRVRLLPFLEEDKLYRQYHLNEPWDSPHNLEVAKTMPKVYQSPGRPDDGKTCFMVFNGKDTALASATGNNVPMFSIEDGLSRTILVVEAGPDKAVPWTKPEDLPFDPAKPLTALGDVPEDGFYAAMCDGSVVHLKVDNATLKALITPRGGEKIDMSTIQRTQ
jgi:hypothetical protein